MRVVFFRTHLGRARAWLRVALMQKKLADYLKVLIDHRDDVLSEYFEPDALMMSEEAIVIIGLLVGLNVIDCNLCIKVSFIFTNCLPQEKFLVLFYCFFFVRKKILTASKGLLIFRFI